MEAAAVVAVVEVVEEALAAPAEVGKATPWADGRRGSLARVLSQVVRPACTGCMRHATRFRAQHLPRCARRLVPQLLPLPQRRATPILLAARTLFTFEDGAELTHSDLEALGMRCVSDEALREFYDALAIDEASGEVGTAILAARLTEAHGINPAHAAMSDAGALTQLVMDATAQRMDTNSDGVISWEEFRVAVRETEVKFLEASFFSEDALDVLGLPSFDDDALRDAFVRMDADQSGTLEKDEIRAIFIQACPELASAPELDLMVSRVMERLDTNDDSMVSWGEFKAAFAAYQAGRGWRWRDGAIWGVWKVL